jgi:divalent metal cation (Fe/Co/Zn/Cd) transporter
MLSESIHSISDTANQFTLLLGKRFARKPNVKKYPFGRTRARYLASFVVAIMFFALGGAMALFESFNKTMQLLTAKAGVAGGNSSASYVAGINESALAEGAAGGSINLAMLWASAAVLVFAIIVESLSLRVAISEAREIMEKEEYRTRSLLKFWKRTKSSEIMVILTEDTLAVIGLSLALVGIITTIITGNPLFDALGGGAIGVLLILGAILLGREIGSLVIGENVSIHTTNTITKTVKANKKVDKFINMQAIHLSESDLLICLKVDLVDTLKISSSAAVNDIERQIRKALPNYNCEIYVEVDVYDPHYRKPRRKIQA